MACNLALSRKRPRVLTSIAIAQHKGFYVPKFHVPKYGGSHGNCRIRTGLDARPGLDAAAPGTPGGWLHQDLLREDVGCSRRPPAVGADAQGPRAKRRGD